MDSKLHPHRIVAAILAMLVGVLAAHAQTTDERLRKAADYIAKGRTEYAIDTYGDILKDDPHCVAALFYRAYCNNQLRRYPLAKADYEAMLLLAPRHSQARLGLSHTLLKMGRKTEALDQVNTIVEQHPDSAFSYVARASVEQELGMEVPAIYDLEKALEINPADADTMLSLAQLYRKGGQEQKARRILQKYRETLAQSK